MITGSLDPRRHTVSPSMWAALDRPTVERGLQVWWLTEADRISLQPREQGLMTLILAPDEAVGPTPVEVGRIRRWMQDGAR